MARSTRVAAVGGPIRRGGRSGAGGQGQDQGKQDEVSHGGRIMPIAMARGNLRYGRWTD
jgi:hypothetical protein